MTPTIDRFTPRDLGYRTWGTELLIAHTPHYLGKVLTMRAGTKGGLQYHREKDEAFYLVSGKAHVLSDNGSGQLIQSVMRPGETFHIPPGAPHQVLALEDCVFFEVSTPHFDDRVRLEGHYGLEGEKEGLPTTDAPRTLAESQTAAASGLLDDPADNHTWWGV